MDRLYGYRVMLSGPVLLELKAKMPKEVWEHIADSKLPLKNHYVFSEEEFAGECNVPI